MKTILMLLALAPLASHAAETAPKVCGPVCTIEQVNYGGNWATCVKMNGRIAECFTFTKSAVKFAKNLKDEGLCN